MGCGQSICRGPSDGVTGNTVNVREIYRLGGVLGSGAFGQVRECTHKVDKQEYAVKIMTKSNGREGSKSRATGHWSNEAMFRREVEILSHLHHKNIVKLHSFYEDKSYLYAVLEKCEGGELFDYILKQGTIDEERACYLTFQMLHALQYTHAHGVVHRDVKAENFLFTTTPDSGEIKLIDFGMSEKLCEDQVLTDVCGSPHYLAPELIRRKYSFKADIWALGVLVYLMLYGKYPFDGASTSDIVKEILSRKLQWANTAGANNRPVSETAQSFVRGLLQRNPDKRPTAHQAMKHPWLTPVRISLDHIISSPRLNEMANDAADENETPPQSSLDIDLKLVDKHDLIIIGNEETRYSQRMVRGVD